MPPGPPTSRSSATSSRSTAQLDAFEEIGATDFVAIPTGTDADRRRTLDHLVSLDAERLRRTDAASDVGGAGGERVGEHDRDRRHEHTASSANGGT